MANACPVLTPAQRKASEIVNAVQLAMMEKVHAAIAEAAEHVRDQFIAEGLDLAPAAQDNFASVVHQRMYLTLCGVTEGCFDGGNPKTAIAIIRNQQQIANHYWRASIEVMPKV